MSQVTSRPGAAQHMRDLADPGITAHERRTIVEMMTKGTYARIIQELR